MLLLNSSLFRLYATKKWSLNSSNKICLDSRAAVDFEYPLMSQKCLTLDSSPNNLGAVCSAYLKIALELKN